jgi:hypothetical protein
MLPSPEPNSAGGVVRRRLSAPLHCLSNCNGILNPIDTALIHPASAPATGPCPRPSRHTRPPLVSSTTAPSITRTLVLLSSPFLSALAHLQLPPHYPRHRARRAPFPTTPHRRTASIMGQAESSVFSNLEKNSNCTLSARLWAGCAALSWMLTLSPLFELVLPHVDLRAPDHSTSRGPRCTHHPQPTRCHRVHAPVLRHRVDPLPPSCP